MVEIEIHNHAGVLKIVNMNWNIFYSYKFLGAPVIRSNMYLRKNIYFIMRFPPILNSYSQMKA